MSQLTEAGQTHNPYASPASEPPRPEAPAALDQASSGQRLVTFVLDYIGVLIVGIVSGVVLGLLGVDPEGFDTLFGFVVMFGYYVGFEAALGRTPGKIIVGTRVVTLSGEEPTFGQCVGRSLARLVPFEPFSFLGRKSIGWHDRWTATRVIRTR